MANLPFGLNVGVQLGFPNGPNEPLPPNQPVEPGFIGPIFIAAPESYAQHQWRRQLSWTWTSELARNAAAAPPEEFLQGAFHGGEAFSRAGGGISPGEQHYDCERGRLSKPVLRVYEANFPACLVEALEANNCTSDPTPIEAQCWSILLKRRDLLAVLRTSDGKTMAYILPAIVHVMHQPTIKPHQGFLALVLAPTTEDARKIQQMVGELETHSGVRAACVCSCDSKDRQLEALSRGFEICVATSGRLYAFLKEGKLNICRCTYLVLDEADRMVDIGFEQHLIAIAKYVRPDRQTLMLTSRRPKELYRLIDTLLKDYVKVHFNERQPLPNQSVEHVVPVSAESEKEARLVTLLEDILSEQENGGSRKAIVFAQTRKRVDGLVFNLRRRGWSAVGLHGGTTDLAQNQALTALREASTPILVATDVATWRLSSENVDYVVNHDCPRSTEAYSQRISHVSLSTSEPAVAHTFLEPDDNQRARKMIDVLRTAKKKVHPELFEITEKTKRRKVDNVTEVWSSPSPSSK
ncbi:putative ATP-dependent RNA helicase DDX5 [Rhipicephalus microplus]|uniref:putative ATP-dependent RNA helicase DDX5 n=1 Tax=Rhipicephalus microplus TaxID=6941 RepID=UPI003F6A9F6C